MVLGTSKIPLLRLHIFAIAGLIAAIPFGASAQAPAYKARHTADGHPNLSGVWQALNTANWDLQAHAAKAGPVVDLGATAAIPGGLGVVEGGEIPYLPAAAAKKRENAANWVKLDPEVKCYLPGIPRATYLPFPFQIVQGPKRIMFAYEYASGSRIVNMGAPTKAPDDFWMGWSNGHWEGDTLVIDVTNQKEETWFDRAGDFHSDALHVTERYTPVSPDALMYEAQIEDPKTFSRPWKIGMPLYRRLEKNAQLLDFKCPEFVEDLLYGHLKKKTGP